MADSTDKDLKIGITTTADLAAAKDTTASMKEVGAAAETAAQQSSEAAKQTSAAIESTAAAAKENAAALEQVSTATEAAKTKTAETVTSVDDLAKGFVTANEKAAEWGNTISKLNNDQLLQLEERLRADIAAADALGQSTDDLKRKLSETYSQRTTQLDESLAKTAAKGKDVATAVDGASKSLKSMQQAGQGARNVLDGLSQGGLGGLAKAATGATTVFRTLMTGALGAPLLVVVGAAAGAMLLLRKRLEENQAAIKKMYDEAATARERMKVAFEEIEKAAEKSAQAQIASIEKVSKSYADYLATIERGDARTKKRIKLEGEGKLASIDKAEQQALATVVKKESVRGLSAEEKEKLARERERITRGAQQQREEFKTSTEVGEIETQANNARLKLDANAEAGIRLQAERDAVRANLEAKRKELEDTKAIGSTIAKRDDADPVDRKAARDKIRIAQEAVTKAEAKDKEVQTTTADATARIEEDNRNARAQLENARQRGSNKITELQTDSQKRTNDFQPTRARLAREAQEALERGDGKAQDKAVAELRQLEKENTAATAANTRAMQALTAAIGAKESLAATAPRAEPVTAPALEIKSVDGEETPSSGGTIKREGEEAIDIAKGEVLKPRSKVATIQRAGDSAPVPLEEAAAAARETAAAAGRAAKATREASQATTAALDSISDTQTRTAKRVKTQGEQIANSRP